MTHPIRADRVYLRASPLQLQERVLELRARQALLRRRIEEYLEGTGEPLRAGTFEDHTDLLAALQRGPAHLAAERARIAVDIAALVHGLHEALHDATPLSPADVPAQSGTVYVLTEVDARASAALADIRQLLLRWVNRWSRYQSNASGPPA